MSRGRALRWTAGVTALLAAAPAAAQLPLPEPQPETRPAPARVVYSTDRSLRTINADGSDMREVAKAPSSGSDSAPAWSPDGGSIAFVRAGVADNDEDFTQVWIIGADGSGARTVSPQGSEDLYEQAPAWAPDGRELALVRTRLGRTRAVTSIVAVNLADGSRRTIHSEARNLQETGAPVSFFALAWSPRGDTILFTRVTPGGDDDDTPSVHAVPAAGGEPRVLLRNARHASWSPDAARIAYESHQDGFGSRCIEECGPSGEIYVSNADGTDPRRLTTSRADDSDPSWSGDGGRIAFHSDRNARPSDFAGNPPEVYSVKPDGSCLTWLTNGTADSEEPAFQPDPSLSSDPGACEPPAREPLVEPYEDLGEIEDSRRRFPAYWLGRVAPNGLLLTGATAGLRGLDITYADCARFDPAECGTPLLLMNDDLCYAQSPIGGLRPGAMSIFRGALFNVQREDDLAWSQLYVHRTLVQAIDDAGRAVSKGLLDLIQPVGGQRAAGAKFPSTRLPARVWRALRERPAIRRRLSQLGVKRRLGCDPRAKRG